MASSPIFLLYPSPQPVKCIEIECKFYGSLVWLKPLHLLSTEALPIAELWKFDKIIENTPLPNDILDG